MSKSFSPGVLVFTEGVDEYSYRASNDMHNSYAVVQALGRHLVGDWGELETADRICNDEALAQGGRLFSCYTLKAPADPQKIYIITEADRSTTTVLLPEEY